MEKVQISSGPYQDRREVQGSLNVLDLIVQCNSVFSFQIIHLVKMHHYSRLGKPAKKNKC